MKKFFGFIIAIILVMTFAVSAHAANYDYWAEVYRTENTTVGEMELERITTGITFQVLTIDSDTEATVTVYNDDSTTSLTNPVTSTNFESSTVCDEKVRFRSTASTVDLIVVDEEGGFSVFIEDFSPNKHRIVIDERPNVMHHGVIWFDYSDDTATDTGINILPDTFIHDVRVEIVTVDAGETLGVGTLSTATGFRWAVSTATVGYPSDTAVITNGSTSDYTPASTYGPLLVTAITGSDSSTAHGGKSYIGHITTTAGTDDDLYYTGSDGSDTAAGYIHYFFTRMR